MFFSYQSVVCVLRVNVCYCREAVGTRKVLLQCPHETRAPAGCGSGLAGPGWTGPRLMILLLEGEGQHSQHACSEWLESLCVQEYASFPGSDSSSRRIQKCAFEEDLQHFIITMGEVNLQTTAAQPRELRQKRNKFHAVMQSFLLSFKNGGSLSLRRQSFEMQM